MAASTGGEADSVEPIAVTAGKINSELAQTIPNLQSIVLKLQDAAEASPLQSSAIALQQHALRLKELIDPVRSVLRPERFYQAGLVAAADGRLEIAAGLFRRALELRADYPQARKALDDVLQKQGQIEIRLRPNTITLSSIKNLTSSDASLSDKFKMYHVGCGPLLADWFLNIDGNFEFESGKLYAVKGRPSTYLLKHDLRNGIPAGTDSLEVIYHAHFFEHLTDHEGIAFLSECHRCLAPGGLMRFAVPDFEL